MSLPVWPSAFIRRAMDLGGVVYLAGPTELPAVCPGGFTLNSGPLLEQLALELSRTGRSRTVKCLLGAQIDL